MRRNPLPCAAQAAPIPAKAGVGLRFPHHKPVLAGEAEAAWFEVHPENYLGDGIIPDILERVRRDFPVSLHATGLSLGSVDGVEEDHLGAIAASPRRIEPGLISDHLSWSASVACIFPICCPSHTRARPRTFLPAISTACRRRSADPF